MKKFLMATLIVAAIASSAPVIQFVRAQTVDLGVENVGLLPSNPFYFLKEWGRGVKKFFTTNQINKTKLEIDTVNEKAAEIEKLVEITPYNKSGLINSFANYQAAVEALIIRLNSFTETVVNPDVTSLVNDIISRAILHQKLFDQIASKYVKDVEILAAARAASDDSVGILAAIISKIDRADDFRIRFEAAARGGEGAFRDLPAAELADQLSERFFDEAHYQMFALRLDLLADWSGYLEGLQQSAFGTLGDAISMLPGDSLRLLRLLDGVREITQNSDLHNTLNISRQTLLEGANARGAFTDGAVAAVIASVSSLITEVEAMPGSVKSSVKEALNRAKFNLAQAEKFYQDEQYQSAFGQASAASAAAMTAWARLAAPLFGGVALTDSLKEYYDAISTAALNAGISKEQNPEVSALLGNAEKQLIGISKLIEGNAKPEVIADATQSVRVSLSLIDQMINDILNPPLPAPAPEAKTMSASNLIPESATVVISSAGFLPSVVSVRPGTKVTWFNKDIKPHWPASDPYPAQTDLPNFDAKGGLSQGETYSFTFEKVGKWGYHDHLNPELSGTIEVRE